MFIKRAKLGEYILQQCPTRIQTCISNLARACQIQKCFACASATSLRYIEVILEISIVTLTFLSESTTYTFVTTEKVSDCKLAWWPWQPGPSQRLHHQWEMLKTERLSVGHSGAHDKRRCAVLHLKRQEALCILYDPDCSFSAAELHCGQFQAGEQQALSDDQKHPLLQC